MPDSRQNKKSDSNIDNIIPKSNITELFTTSPQTLIEGLTSTAYCQPIDVIDTEAAQEAELSIPLSGMYTPNDATNNIIRTSMNLMSFVLVLGFTYLITPIIYNEYIIGLIEVTGQAKLNRVRSIDVYITGVFIMATISLISLGVRNNNPNATIGGFLLGLFFIISFFIIQSKKMAGGWFTETFSANKKSQGEIITANYDNVNMSSDFFGGFLFTNLMIFIKNIFIGAIIFFVFILFGYLTGSFSDKGLLNSGDGIIYLSLFTIYLTIAISIIRTKIK